MLHNVSYVNLDERNPGIRSKRKAVKIGFSENELPGMIRVIRSVVAGVEGDSRSSTTWCRTLRPC